MNKPAGMAPLASPINVALLVDRDADTRRMYAEYMKFSAWSVDEAADGREALAKAIAGHPDIIVTESRLPGINGFDLCSILKRDSTTRAIPIVMVTGDAFAVDLQRARSVGADAVLVKPCLPETLVDEIQRLLKQSKDLRARAVAARNRIGEQLQKSDVLLERSRQTHRIALSRAHQRHDTTTPPLAPPALICPACDQPLLYQRSHIGGVSARNSEQWDYFDCPHGCGTFQYRERTRKLRKVQ
ncbi:MAG TPA: response regulator [Vicinamibacterales bacterium]|jgi:CheY-like chemotaxis protein|nr:response regulator [Vicinamibacterales bacterium]